MASPRTFRIPSRRRRTIRVLLRRQVSAALLGTVFAAGCGAGFNAASVAVRPNSGTAQNGNVKVNNVWVVVDPATRNAEVIGAVANIGRVPDRLTAVRAGGMQAVVRPGTPVPASVALPIRGVTVEGDSVVFAAGGAASFGRAGGPELELSNAPFVAGRLTRVEMDFQLGGQVPMNALVMANTGQFAEYDPNGANPVGSPSAGASASASASASTSGAVAAGVGAASASPSVSPTILASPTH